MRPKARTDRAANFHLADGAGSASGPRDSTSTSARAADGAAAGVAEARAVASGCSDRANCGWCCSKLIADEPRHGYDLIRAIEELTGGDYAPSPGVIYPTLTMLTDMGLIEEQAAEGSRKAFAVTKEGKAHLKENAEEVEALFERLEEAAPDKRPRAAIRRSGGRSAI